MFSKSRDLKTGSFDNTSINVYNNMNLVNILKKVNTFLTSRKQ